MSNNLADLFLTSSESNAGALKMFNILEDKKVFQVAINSHDRIFITTETGVQLVRDIFPDITSYIRFLDMLLELTDVKIKSIDATPLSIIEGSFDKVRTNIRGSIHIATKELTRGEPTLTIRKQPLESITLDTMLTQGMMSPDMRTFLEIAIRGRSNILISGGSGAGKTTLIKALSWFVDPNHRILVAEEIDELHLEDNILNLVSLTTHKIYDDKGKVIDEISLEDLVKEALRMRADRIWVGETRGKEAYALVKACNSGHDGSLTTIHADSGKGAIKQLVTYVMESNLTEEVAREQVAQAFHLVIQISKVKFGKRVITEITELEPVREGTNQRSNIIFTYDHEIGNFKKVGSPSVRLLNEWAKNGANLPSASFNITY